MADISMTCAGSSCAKAHSGNEETRNELKAWLASGRFVGLRITGGWDAKEEWAHGAWSLTIRVTP